MRSFIQFNLDIESKRGLASNGFTQFVPSHVGKVAIEEMKFLQGSILLEHVDKRIDTGIGRERVARKVETLQRGIAMRQSVSQMLHSLIVDLISEEAQCFQRSIGRQHLG